jgi:hypothetical protein
VVKWVERGRAAGESPSGHRGTHAGQRSPAIRQTSAGGKHAHTQAGQTLTPLSRPPDRRRSRPRCVAALDQHSDEAQHRRRVFAPSPPCDEKHNATKFRRPRTTGTQRASDGLEAASRSNGGEKVRWDSQMLSRLRGRKHRSNPRGWSTRGAQLPADTHINTRLSRL